VTEEAVMAWEKSSAAAGPGLFRTKAEPVLEWLREASEEEEEGEEEDGDV
jgi:hypothetical protein